MNHAESLAVAGDVVGAAAAGVGARGGDRATEAAGSGADGAVAPTAAGDGAAVTAAPSVASAAPARSEGTWSRVV